MVTEYTNQTFDKTFWIARIERSVRLTESTSTNIYIHFYLYINEWMNEQKTV